MGCQWKWNIEWNTYCRWMKRNFKSPEREMKQRMKHLPERMKNYLQGLRMKQVPWTNEMKFHSFLVVDQDFVWYSSAVHDVSGSYQSLHYEWAGRHTTLCEDWPLDLPSRDQISDSFPDEDWKGRTQLLISVDPKICKEFTEGCETDNFFAPRYIKVQPNEKTVISITHFQRGQDNLLYFIDASWKTQLCVPKSKINYVLWWIHESPYESAHAGPHRFLAWLQELFYWPKMNKDVELYTTTCAVCQKIKTDHHAKMGMLRPPHIPSWPFLTVSMDLITGLPASGEMGYTTILVIVE